MDSVAAQNKAIAGSIMKTVLDETGEAVFVGLDGEMTKLTFEPLRLVLYWLKMERTQKIVGSLSLHIPGQSFRLQFWC